jgi:hypothetical protein
MGGLGGQEKVSKEYRNLYFSFGTSGMQPRNCKGVHHACTLRSTSNKHTIRVQETNCGMN